MLLKNKDGLHPVAPSEPLGPRWRHLLVPLQIAMQMLSDGRTANGITRSMGLAGSGACGVKACGVRPS